MSAESLHAVTSPAPVSFSPSQYFDGNDGKWSTFVVRIGTPEQSFRVLPSTVTSETFIPLAGACKDNQTMSKQDCTFSRGAELYQGRINNGFQANLSSTWHEIGIYQTATREELGYKASGLYGLDTLGLMIANSGGPTLKNQTIGAVVNPRLWVGWLGMDVKPSNFSDFDNPQPSLIKTLKDQGHIPSLSYGYTAGAHYKSPSVYGSLTYGGYDQSRFVPNDVTFPFDANDSRKPSLSIQTILTEDLSGQIVDVLSMSVKVQPYTLIDFAESQLWLPVAVCDAFEKAFNLTYDNSTDLYLVDPSTHAKLVERNPTITFGLGKAPSDLSERVNIAVPYSAFDQQASYPIYDTPKNYFPIRRAYSESQYTLGRTFFQEAYFKIDYERGNFSVHQALFPTDDKQKIVPISSPDAAKADLRTEFGKGAIAGIAVGSVLMLVIMLLATFWFFRRRRGKNEKQPAIEVIRVECEDHPKVETEGAAVYEKDGMPFAEMEGHIFPELHCPEQETETRELDIRITRADLSAIFELYGSTGDKRSSVEPESRSEEKVWPPPGWI